MGAAIEAQELCALRAESRQRSGRLQHWRRDANTLVPGLLALTLLVIPDFGNVFTP